MLTNKELTSLILRLAHEGLMHGLWHHHLVLLFGDSGSSGVDGGLRNNLQRLDY